MGSGRRQIRLGFALGMDTLRLSSVSGLQKIRGCRRRIQRQVYDQPDGTSRLIGGNTRRPQPKHVSEFFPSAPTVAVFGITTSKMTSGPSTELNQLATDVLAGLSARPKHLSSKYFY